MEFLSTYTLQGVKSDNYFKLEGVRMKYFGAFFFFRGRIEKMDIKIIKDSISKEELKNVAEKQFGNLVKAVVDIEKEIMAIGGELHADEEALLIADGSLRENTWGINLYPEKTGEDFIEFDSMVNLKPARGNRSRGVENAETREKIIAAVKKLVPEQG